MGESMKYLNTRKIIDSLSNIFFTRINDKLDSHSNLRDIFLTRIGKILPAENNDSLDQNNFDGDSLVRYTGEDYRAINALLWHKEEFLGGIEGLEQAVKDVIEITDNMSCTPQANDTFVYRGTKIDHYPELLGLKKGMTLPLNGITSTSLDYETAEFFTENNNVAFERSSPLIFKIKLDDKTPFSRPTSLSTLCEIEQEVILPPAEYEIVSVTPSKSKYSATEVEMKPTKTLDIQKLIIDGLDYLIDNDPMKTHDIFTEDIIKLKKKVNNYYKKKRREKIRNFLENEIDTDQLSK